MYNLYKLKQNNSVSIVARLRAGRPEFESRQEQRIFLVTASRRALEPTQPPIQLVRGAHSPGAKGPGVEADHSPSPSAEVMNSWSYTSTSSTSSWRGRGNFKFTLWPYKQALHIYVGVSKNFRIDS
jgi:hypothetical protein